MCLSVAIGSFLRDYYDDDDYYIVDIYFGSANVFVMDAIILTRMRCAWADTPEKITPHKRINADTIYDIKMFTLL